MRIAVVIPCHNEELTVAKVVADFKRVLPDATVYVIDNASTDRTVDEAARSGALLIHECRKGKGYAVQTMFEKIEADYYVMVDGDDTYNADEVLKLLSEATSAGGDMVIGTRLSQHTEKAFRSFHYVGNRLVCFLINRFFGVSLNDVMSGYRVMGRNFVKSVPLLTPGFEIETEMTLKALYYGYTVKQVDISYGERPTGSYSKLNTFRDGYRVLSLIAIIFRDYRPLFFFSFIGCLMLLIGLLSGGIVIEEFLRTRYITHVPLAILAASSVVTSLLSFTTGLILDTLTRRFKELMVLNKKK